MAAVSIWGRSRSVLPIDETEEIDERDADEPLAAEAEAQLVDEVELPLELIGVPFN